MSNAAGERNARSKPYDRPQARPHADDGKWLHDMAPGSKVPASVVNSSPRGGPPSNRLIVSNLHYDITAKDLIAIFGQIGTLVRDPSIKYDRSGRSTGIGYVHYETPTEATRAKNQFHGILAKGQPMSIVFETLRPPRRTPTAPALMDRISKRPLLERLTSDTPTPTGPRKAVQATAPPKGQSGAGPIRNRGTGRRRGGRSEKPKVITAEGLDEELDNFMGDKGDSVVMEKDVEMDT
ncbi:hypothetical protein M0805_001333 [Coniferiporia weirii]|nr:hypothetical protein M0805_001333 [Coniferiporia weirii]